MPAKWHCRANLDAKRQADVTRFIFDDMANFLAQNFRFRNLRRVSEPRAFTWNIESCDVDRKVARATVCLRVECYILRCSACSLQPSRDRQLKEYRPKLVTL